MVHQQLNLFGMMRVTVSILVSILLVSCVSNSSMPELKQTEFNQRISGNTQGTTYEIKLIDDNTFLTKKEVDSVLHDFDLELSGYDDNSILSKINAKTLDVIPSNSIYFRACFNRSQEIASMTNGAFDPTIFPLVKAWGFFSKPYKVPSDSVVNDLLKGVGYQQLKLVNDSLKREEVSTTLDFNAIAQGYSVDVLKDFLLKKGFDNFYIEIGGEVFVYGDKEDNTPWYLAIDYPSKSNKQGEERVAEAIIAIDENKAIATSGNYRKVFEYQGKVYGHSLNPKTGKPAENSTRSVTVIANSCMDADAFATAFMVMGHSESIKFLNENKQLNIQAYFLFDEGEGLQQEMSPDFSRYIVSAPNGE